MSQSPALPNSGDIVGGKYVVGRKLGSGGMGAVFEVTHRVTNKRFAIKWLLPEVATEDGALKRFMREAQVAGRFEHPNVVEVYDIGQDGSSFYMVMELLEGESLADRISRARRLTPQQALVLLVPCMEGVAAAHGAGIIHRDLKPANLFVVAARGREAEHGKVLDFGISKLSSKPGIPDATLTRAGAVMGTPHYMAPEQMRAQPVDERADIYAFGVILYEALTGQRPFDAQTFADLVLKVLAEPAKPLRQQVPEISAGLSDVVMRAMAREPEARFASLRELVEALEPYYESAHARQAPAMEPVDPRANTARPPRAAAETGEHPETPLFSESIYSSSSKSFRWHRIQLWLAGTFGVGLLVAFVAAVFSKPDTAVLRTPAAPSHEVKPLQPLAALPEETPEPLPTTTRLEPDAVEQPRVEGALDAGMALKPEVDERAQPAAAELEAAVKRASTREAPAITPKRSRKQAASRQSGSQTTGVRPRVELDRDNF